MTSARGSSGLAPAVEIRSLRVRYGEVVAVDGLDLVAERGQIIALLGPNGAGKTSTLEVLEGYRRPASGEVRVFGFDPVADRRHLSPRVGVMLQRGGVYPGMGPREALQLFASYYRSPDEPERLIALLGLATVARTPWRRLSGGEQQRLSLGLALVGRPRALFLDEPTSGVDPEGRQVMRQVIGDLRENGACVLLTTHELEEAGRLADRLIVIDRGRVVAAGTQDELAALAGHAEVRWSTTPALEIAALQAELGARVWEERPGEYVAAVTGTPTVVAAIANWLADNRLPLAAMRAGRPALEDVYLRLTKGAGAQDEAGAQKDKGAQKDHGAQK